MPVKRTQGAKSGSCTPGTQKEKGEDCGPAFWLSAPKNLGGTTIIATGYFLISMLINFHVFDSFEYSISVSYFVLTLPPKEFFEST